MSRLWYCWFSQAKINLKTGKEDIERVQVLAEDSLPENLNILFVDDEVRLDTRLNPLIEMLITDDK